MSELNDCCNLNCAQGDLCKNRQAPEGGGIVWGVIAGLTLWLICLLLILGLAR